MATSPISIPAAILRRQSVEANTGISRSTLYRRVKQGTFPPPVSLGGERVGWPAREIEALNQARIAGTNDEGIKTLVIRLIAERTAAGSAS